MILLTETGKFPMETATFAAVDNIGLPVGDTAGMDLVDMFLLEMVEQDLPCAKARKFLQADDRVREDSGANQTCRLCLDAVEFPRKAVLQAEIRRVKFLPLLEID